MKRKACSRAVGRRGQFSSTMLWYLFVFTAVAVAAAHIYKAYLYLYLRVSADTDERNLERRTQAMCKKKNRFTCVFVHK